MPETAYVPVLPSPWLTRRQLAQRLGLSPKTLANWASAGKGPKFTKKFGNGVRYHIANVEKWESSLADE
ncbi:helix-turn-helix transcriptional regulator [Nocardia miyunensis]|uniref:helix-turn-helix transcriptional regulator n=1 Tax=Nocardia miyunensis TaxID=282684 RepID=UPI00082F2715|nr:helix-turn-helix domain-containing protein [Nocardia miyunensis]